MKWDWKAILGVAISIFLIWWVLRDVDAREVWREVRGVNWWLLTAAVAVATSGFLTRSLRWKVFLHPISPTTSLSNRFAAVNIGFAANNLLPARVGEFARAWSISRLEPVTISGAVGSLVVERLFDAVAILLLFFVALLHPLFPSDARLGGQPIQATLVGVLVALAILVTGLILLIGFPRTFLRWTDRVLGLAPSRIHRFLGDMAESFLQGLGSLRSLKLLVVGLIASLGIWAWNGVSFWLAFMAFGIDQGYATALFVQAVIAMGVSIPSAPGYFGTWHAAALLALHEVYAVGEGATLAFAFGYHLAGFFPVTLLGLWYAGRLGLSLSELGNAGDGTDPELEPQVYEAP